MTEAAKDVPRTLVIMAGLLYGRCLWFFEVARLLVRLDHVASGIVEGSGNRLRAEPRLLSIRRNSRLGFNRQYHSFRSAWSAARNDPLRSLVVMLNSKPAPGFGPGSRHSNWRVLTTWHYAGNGYRGGVEPHFRLITVFRHLGGDLSI